MRLPKIVKILTCVLILLSFSTFLTGTGHASSWADEMITELVSRQIIDSIPENPDEPVMREAAYDMLLKAMRGADTETEPDLDIPVIPRDGDLLLTRQDAALLIGRWLDLDPSERTYGTLLFTDDDDISAHSRNIVYRLFDIGIINGYPDGSFKPLGNISFAEMSSLIYRVLSRMDAGLATYFGSGVIGSVNGTHYASRFAMPHGLCIDNDGNLIIFDTFNASVRRIKDNRSETVLGSRSANANIRDDHGFIQAFYLDGARENALFGRPVGGVHAPGGDLFIVDSVNHAVRVLRGERVYTFAGGTCGFADGRRGAAQFAHPAAIAIDGEGNLYVADTQNHAVRKIAPDGTVSTIAGIPGKQGFADGKTGESLFCDPSGIAVGTDGAVYVADTGNHLIRKIHGGVVTTIAGVISDTNTEPDDGEYYRPGGYADGAAAISEFNFPRGIYYAGGVLIIADTGNHAVRLLQGGRVSTIAGNGDPGDEDGLLGMSMMNKPTAVVYSDGVIYIADSLNNKIKMIQINFKER
jgi:sugar lactone lactonase YvrE